MFKNSSSQNFGVDNVIEFYYITDIKNLDSICKRGILSHKRAEKIKDHVDISNPEVQDRRASKKIKRANPDKPERTIHRHVNLYLNPHNAMMYVKKEEHENLCVLKIRKEILGRGDAILSDRNASTNNANFFKPNEYSLGWRSKGYITEDSSLLDQNASDSDKEDKKQIRQAECLLPYEVAPCFIGGVMVSCEKTKKLVEKILKENNKNVPTIINLSMFFQSTYNSRDGIKCTSKFLKRSPWFPSDSLQQDVNLNMALPESDSESEQEQESTSQSFQSPQDGKKSLKRGLPEPDSDSDSESPQILDQKLEEKAINSNIARVLRK